MGFPRRQAWSETHTQGLIEYTAKIDAFKSWITGTIPNAKAVVDTIGAAITAGRVTKMEIICSRVLVKSSSEEKRIEMVHGQIGGIALDMNKCKLSVPDLSSVVWPPLWQLLQPYAAKPLPAKTDPALATGAVVVSDAAEGSVKDSVSVTSGSKALRDKKDKQKKAKKA